MRLNILKAIALVPVLLIGLACSSQRASHTADDNSYKDSVKQALQQADLQDVTVDEDKDKNTITLEGKLHSEDPAAGRQGREGGGRQSDHRQRDQRSAGGSGVRSEGDRVRPRYIDREDIQGLADGPRVGKAAHPLRRQEWRSSL